MRDFRDYLGEIRSQGRLSFSIEEVCKEYNTSRSNIDKLIAKMKKKNELISPMKGFFVIIPPEHRPLGCLPPDILIPVLFRRWNIDYYVCLLSAGLYNGASHQKPNRFQVVTEKNFLPPLRKWGDVYVEFVYKKSIKGLPLKEKVVDTGVLKIATPELLAMDLFLYPRKCGGLNHIATVLSELIEEIDLEKFKKFATESEHTFWMQRMGYILDSIDPMEEEKKEDIMKILEDVLKTRKTYFTPIEPVVKHKGANRNKKWKIIENATVESDV